MKFLFLLLIGVTIADAQYQKIDAAINPSGRKLSFHLYHFDSQKNSSHLHSQPKSIASSIPTSGCIAGIALRPSSAKPHYLLSTKNGTLKVGPSTAKGLPIGPRLFPLQAKKMRLNNKHHARRSFLLHNGKNRWAIGYAPSINQVELAHAVAEICKKNPHKYSLAYQINVGDSAGIWIKNGSYQPFYLKEIKSPAFVLGIKSR